MLDSIHWIFLQLSFLYGAADEVRGVHIQVFYVCGFLEKKIIVERKAAGG